MCEPSEASGELMKERYSRQIRFAPIGEEGQRRLGQAKVLIAGTGSLGASLAQHMARAGVGELRLADRDYVELSNLQRQMLFDEEDARLALPKAEAAARKLRRINSLVGVKAYVADLAAPGALEEIASGCDLILDGTDNADVRLALSDYCFRAGIPFLYGGAAGAEGMSAPLVPGATCCLRCLIGGEEEQEGGQTCETAGMLAPAVELIAALQAAEALKWLSGCRQEMRLTLVSASVWPYSMREMRLPGPVRGCSYCWGRVFGQHQHLSDEGSSPISNHHAVESSIPISRNRHSVESAIRDWSGAVRPKPGRWAVLCGRDTVQLQLEPADPGRYAERLQRLGCSLIRNPYLLRAELPAGGGRLVVFPDGRVLAQGVRDLEEAWAKCCRYLGAEAPEREDEVEDEEA